MRQLHAHMHAALAEAMPYIEPGEAFTVMLSEADPKTLDSRIHVYASDWKLYTPEAWHQLQQLTYGNEYTVYEVIRVCDDGPQWIGDIIQIPGLEAMHFIYGYAA